MRMQATLSSGYSMLPSHLRDSGSLGVGLIDLLHKFTLDSLKTRYHQLTRQTVHHQ